MTMARIATVSSILSLLFALIAAQFQDDSDYNDLDFYGDLSFDYESFRKDIPSSQDDFYIITGFDEQNPVDTYPNKDLSLEKDRNEQKWYRLHDKVYRYTKHRISGYDYEELDYFGTGNLQRCDEKSVWTHCLCQFTCAQPDVVDCFTPCKSGCECKEDYVFDDVSQTCVLPEECSQQPEFIYNE